MECSQTDRVLYIFGYCDIVCVHTLQCTMAKNNFLINIDGYKFACRKEVYRSGISVLRQNEKWKYVLFLYLIINDIYDKVHIMCNDGVMIEI